MSEIIEAPLNVLMDTFEKARAALIVGLTAAEAQAAATIEGVVRVGDTVAKSVIDEIDTQSKDALERARGVLDAVIDIVPSLKTEPPAAP